MGGLREKSTGFLKIVLRLTVCIILIIILFYAARAAFTWGELIFSDEGVAESPGTDITIEVPEGTSIRQLGSILVRYGIVDNANIFYVQSLIYEVSEVEPGTYTLNNSDSAEDILDVIRNGPNGDGTEEEEEEQQE